MPIKPPEIVAAVDLGSNSFHMIVCNLNNGTPQTIDRLREMVRLASGLDTNNILDESTQNRALACLERFGQRIRHFPPGSVRIVGTNTLRTAKNAAQFLIKAEQALNHPIHIISGIEEARLIYLGVAYSLSSNAKLRLVIDIGGGSTEYIIGTGETPKEKESLHMGCVSLSDAFFKEGRLSKQAFSQATLFAEQKLEPFKKKFHYSNWDEAIGASGSLRSIAKVLQAANWSNNGITWQGLEKLVAHINQCDHINNLNLPDLDPERLPVFPGGVAIIYATFKSLGIEQMTVSDGALREGLIQDLVGRIYNEDMRSVTAQSVADRYHTDKKHAAQINKTINIILNQLSDHHDWATDEDCVQFLDWAADLHEIGIDIAHSQYHKHSAYIIENGDLAGFSNQDQLLLASIIRAHRRKFSQALFQDLPPPWNNFAPYLTLVLRLAVLLHRNRLEQALPDFKIAIIKTKIYLTFPGEWLTLSPLTYADLLQEADYLKAAGFKLEFT
ncbi:exopolyphosphatase [Methylobacter sp. S3L5C]|uniref:exopolyphosphatase n=1 Tax=Methylobacter sp. S3L5C TaxID=2839024 RepID=UPI001FAE007C|nr:exopolyphosphatase [Methylobacter sp. S3L5C]UOA08842.1 exopolyphosphatase [Methylobacter sp. S3L5C]